MPHNQTGSYLAPDLSSRTECFFEYETEVKRSRFLTFITRISSRNEAMAFQYLLRQRFPDATHHCLAYVAGAPGSSQQGFDDDGEPSGTAGKPMLNVVQHREIGELAVVVVRYFGGIKLGAGGLVRAYSAAVQSACEQLPVVKMVPFLEAEVATGYDGEQQLRHILQQYQGTVLSVAYSDKATLKIALPETEKQAFSERLYDSSHGQIVILWDD